MKDDAAQRKWQRVLSEYAMARAEYDIAYHVLQNRPRTGDLMPPEGVAELKARQKLLNLRDQMTQLEADSWLDAPGAIAD